MAFAFGIRYLTGRAAATDPAEYTAAEWPPHPARVFMALAAAHFEDPAADDQSVLAEADALRWLEALDPPEIIASDAAPRAVVTSFVPVSDVPALTTGSGKSERALAALQSMSLGRSKQPRTFPSVRPDDETTYLVWPQVQLNGRARPLDQLCRRTTRIGHSSSLVQMWVTEELPKEVNVSSRWQPTGEPAERRLRITSNGLLSSLANDFASGIRPRVGLWQSYRRDGDHATSVSGTIWDADLLIRRLTPVESRHRRLDVRSTLTLAASFHQAVLSVAHRAGLATIPEWISGHRPDGTPSKRPHLACLPLAFVGRQHADGHLLGLGIALPGGTKPAERRHLLGVLIRMNLLRLGRLGLWKLTDGESEVPERTLRSVTWSGDQHGAIRWATVTPIVFDQHPKGKDPAEYEREAVAIVCQSCARVGLPEPREAILTSVSAHLGVPASHEFPRMRRKDGSERRHRHAILIFDEPVRGPIAIGAGRYRGYGFCRPLRGEVFE